MIVPFSVSDFIDRAVQVYGERVGVVDEPDQPAPLLPGSSAGGELTYAEIGALAARQAAKLDELGLEVGDRVAIVSHNSARLLTAFFGVSGWGRVLVPVNFRLRPDEVRYIVEHSGARVLLVDPELEESLKGVDAEFKFVLGNDDELYAAAGSAPRPWEPDENATACINYTSGTTARPKGVQITHRNIWVNAVTFAMHATVSDRDVYLHTLPMFHANGWGMPYAMTGLGVKHVVLRKVDGAEILRRVRDHGVTVMCAAPAVAAAVLEAAQTWEGEIPGRDRVRIIMAGAPPPTKTVARVQEELGWEFIQIYGLTETSPLLTFNRTREEWDGLDAEERASLLTRAGAPALGVRLRISEGDPGDSADSGGGGEVLARSNVVLEGYWEQPEESARALEDGWFHTGDGGSIGDDGYLTISDRKKDVIITGGENVSSIEVEDVLFSHPAVAEVCVIGVPSEKWGETIKALVVLAEGQEATEADLIAWCKDRAAGYKAPTSVEFRDELARTATGKLQKFKLRAPYWEGRGRQVN
ncbi:AMP-binding protein [Nocardioides sp. YIM 152315]|uniref:AMP-binding protein n=1 Tax=Nocardioides sp. YIM 152315 TaxID=3031760 RepID=UPI0023DA6943|nr:AMP-binding protein [Nocardioides sp. YIM 152315]MDF1604179.1 AMP-binding protein [Nocardioides sp. YIM 152315]